MIFSVQLHITTRVYDICSNRLMVIRLAATLRASLVRKGIVLVDIKSYLMLSIFDLILFCTANNSMHAQRLVIQCY